MGAIPGFLLRHTVHVETYQGDTAYGPKYALPAALRCFLEEDVRTVRDREGQEVVSSGTFYARLDEATDVCTPESRITFPDGKQTSIIAAYKRAGGGLPTPDHLEVQLI